MPNASRQKNKGFTLIETFVAVTILMISVLGPLGLVSQFYADNAYSRNQIAATFLAQDGAESAINILRNIKLGFMSRSPYGCVGEDPDFEEGDAWMGPLATDSRCVTAGCNIDPLTEEVVWTGCSYDAKTAGCLLRQRSDGFYSTNPNDAETPYRRVVFIEDKTPVGNPDYRNLRVAEITSRVWWSSGWRPAWPVEVKTRVVERLCD